MAVGLWSLCWLLLNLGFALFLGLALHARVERDITWPRGKRLAGFTF
jgi:hypothetical protein